MPVKSEVMARAMSDLWDFVHANYVADPASHVDKQGMFGDFLRWSISSGRGDGLMGSATFFAAMPTRMALDFPEARPGRPYVNGRPGPWCYVGIRKLTPEEVAEKAAKDASAAEALAADAKRIAATLEDDDEPL